MTNPDQKQLNDTRNVADVADALSAVAEHFKEALVKYAAQEPSRPGLSISVADSRTQAMKNFRLITAHGEVEALYDQAFYFGNLVGRYRFFVLAHTPVGDVEARPVWKLLFNEHYRATWDPKQGFEWHFTPGHRDVPEDVRRLVQILLFHIQATLDQY